MSVRAVLYLSGVIAVGVNAVVVWPWLGRVLTVSELAALVGVTAVSAVLAPVAAVGLHSYVLRFLAGGDADEKSSARAAVPWAGAATGLLCAVGILLVLIGLTKPGALAIWIAATSAGLLASAALRGVDAPRRFAAHALGSQTGALVMLGALVQAGAPVERAVAQAGVLVTCGSLLMAVRQATWRQPLAEVLRALRFSVPLVPHLLLAVGLVQLMRVLVASTAPPDQVVEFQFAALLAGGAITIVQATAAHLTTDALRVTDRQFEEAINHAWSHLLATAILALFAVSVFLWVALPEWLPNNIDSRGVAVAVTLMAPAVLLQAVGDVSSTSLMRERRPVLVSFATAGGTVVALTVYALLAFSELDYVQRAACGVAVGQGGRAALAASMARPFITVVWRSSGLLTLPIVVAFLLVGAYYAK